MYSLGRDLLAEGWQVKVEGPLGLPQMAALNLLDWPLEVSFLLATVCIPVSRRHTRGQEKSEVNSLRIWSPISTCSSRLDPFQDGKHRVLQKTTVVVQRTFEHFSVVGSSPDPTLKAYQHLTL